MHHHLHVHLTPHPRCLFADHSKPDLPYQQNGVNLLRLNALFFSFSVNKEEAPGNEQEQSNEDVAEVECAHSSTLKRLYLHSATCFSYIYQSSCR